MKKITGLLLGVFLLASILFLPNSTKANYSVDTQCGFQDDTMYENVNFGGGYYQTFYPKESRITSIVLKLAAFQTDSTAALKFTDANGNELASKSLTVTGAAPVDPTDYSFDGFSEITVTPGQMYKIILLRSDGNTLYWYKTNTCGIQGNVYADFNSRTGVDYVFTTYGYTPATPDNPDENSSIAAPTQVKAEYQANVNKIKISWTKTVTSDITGYHVFRSEVKDSGFTRISQTDRSTTEYLDTVFEPEKTYYYYVKAYKDLTDGAQSNVAEVTVPKTAKKVVIPVATTPTKHSPNWWLYGLIIFDLLLIAFFILYELKLKKLWAKKKEIKK